jgi:hypothetical protein
MNSLIELYDYHFEKDDICCQRCDNPLNEEEIESGHNTCFICDENLNVRSLDEEDDNE